MLKQFFVDVETTGLDESQHGIHQLACIVKYGGKIFRKSWKMNPDALIDQQAIEISGITEKDILSYPDQAEVFREFYSFLNKHINQYDKKDKFHFIAYNAHFDDRFIRQWFNINFNNFFGSYFWQNGIDVMDLASYAFKDQREEFPNFKLTTIAAALDVEVDGDAHDAAVDVEVTFQVYKKLEKILIVNL